MTLAAITTDDHPDRPLDVHLRWLVGDTWSSPDPWAVLIDRAPVDLADGWQVRAQVRVGGLVVACWSTTGDDLGQVELATAEVPVDGGGTAVTSTVRLRHTPAASRAWGPFVARFDCEVTRAGGGESYTITAGRATAVPDVSR